MISGVFREDHPRITLPLPGIRGEVRVEFIVGTGFAGDLTLPGNLAAQLDGEFAGLGERRLANGQRFQCRTYEIVLDWVAESRPVEVLVLEGDPLVGTVLLREHHLHVEMTDGGEALIEPL